MRIAVVEAGVGNKATRQTRMKRKKEHEDSNEKIRHEIYHPSRLRAFRRLPVKSLSVSALGLRPPEPSTFNVQLSTFFELFDLETGFAAPNSDEGRKAM